MMWSGKRVAVTGKHSGQSRSTVELWLAQAGATVVNAVNSKTDLLVVGTGTSEGSKLANAKKHSTPTLEINSLQEALQKPFPFPDRPTSKSKKQIDAETRQRAKAAEVVEQAIEAADQSRQTPWFVGF